MDREELEQWVQFRILKRFDVLVDCSYLETSLLKKLANRLPRTTGENLTYAAWCEQVFGSGLRPRVAINHQEIAGQTRLGSLGLGLASELRRQQRALKEVQSRLDQNSEKRSTPPEAAPTPLPSIETSESWGWRNFYSGGWRGLRRLLGKVENVGHGHIFDYQGATNRDYRVELIELVRSTLADVEQVGFGVNATFPGEKIEEVADAARVFYGSSREVLKYSVGSFVVSEMPTDILHLTDSFHQQASEEVRDEKASLFVEVYELGTTEPLDDEAVQHFINYLQKLFQALAKSADSVPRGVLREKILLGLMLSISAPNCSLEASLAELNWPAWRSPYDDDWSISEEQKFDLDSGEIVDMFIAKLSRQRF
ncbi:hypothetical protein [Pseudomonas syringae]|uniref:Uncharacterized protein n=1 Tax=Pseudomonas syringae pv. syringae TaxID=321 RepID=A0AB35JM16_PSESY|nr:hypothetical protein [Pseudomonas syringae]MBI6752045.1 hypothetical protein [Pseudomonas syringae]MBI6770266.1 hypothetical protein [Pseudomonas syringae]MBI6774952.1 hypothetical protein [Pseudomonas syringae]MBI6791254.1 hypothetical protein [Pseudomonas syringae]MBI6804492.1 hypothetical protein [Pseudomonas syringae]